MSFLSEGEIGHTISPSKLASVLEEYFPLSGSKDHDKQKAIVNEMQRKLTRDEVIRIAIESSGENSIEWSSNDVEGGEMIKGHLSSGEASLLTFEIHRRIKVLG